MKTKTEAIFNFHKETGISLKLCKHLYERYKGDFNKARNDYPNYSNSIEIYTWAQKNDYNYHIGIS